MLAVLLAAMPFPRANAEDSTLLAAYQKEVRPVLAKLCFECHGAEKQKGDIRFDTLDPDLANGPDAETWQDALDQLNLGEMPPPKAKQPAPAERERLATWMLAALREAAEASRYADGRVTSRRLTRYEYANTMRDLLGVNLDFSRDLPPEPASADGFLNNGATLEMSPTQIEIYLEAARDALAEAVVTGDRPKIHRYAQTKTATGNLPRRKVAGHEPVNPEFALDLPEFPRHGEFLLRIRAKAAIPEGQDLPSIRVSLGHVPGIIHVPRITIGEADVSEESAWYTFRGRMEDCPLPGPIAFGSSGFKGMLAMVDFFDADGGELRYPDRVYVQPRAKPKKGQKPKKPPVPPPFGSRLEIAIEAAEFEAPVFASWPPPSHDLLVGGDNQDARQLLRRFMTRAYRRPVSREEVEPAAKLYGGLRANGLSFEEALRESFASVLVSPHFLYRVETRGPASEPQPLDGYELASRLSYFLWSSMPDERLFALAADGRLRDPQMLETEVTRMLANPRAANFAANFADQWFDLDALNRVAVNPEFYPDFDNRLKEDMRLETQKFLAEILHSDGSALDLLDGRWTLLNRRLARHYGLTGPRSSRFELVALPPDGRRGGLLGQGAFLLANSNGEDSHPIKRAVWILDRLLDSPPAPPPPDVPELDPANPDLAGLSLKEQLAIHREKESCGNCHRGIDSWGIPLENFDAVGNWRSQIPARGKKSPAVPVDVTSVLPSGAEIAGVAELKRYLLEERREWFARAVVKRLMAYALGRSLDLGDRADIEKLTAGFVAGDFRLRGLIVDFVRSDAFLTK